MKLDLRIAIETLLGGGASHREMERCTGVDRKAIRRVAREANSPRVATGSGRPAVQISPPRPPADSVNPAVRATALSTSACEPHRAWIDSQVQLGRNAVSIYQDLVEGPNAVVGIEPCDRRIRANRASALGTISWRHFILKNQRAATLSRT